MYFMNLPAVYNSPPDLFVNIALFTSRSVLSFNICLLCAKAMSIVFISRCLYRVSQKKGNHLIFRDILFVFKHKRFRPLVI